MGDMLSQDEINALLGVVDGEKPNETIDTEPSEQKLEETKEEENKENTSQNIESDIDITDDRITSEEKDILGELANISMGTSATTLYAIVNNKVSITTPTVTVTYWNKISSTYNKPCVGIRVSYKEGLKGSNVLLLKEKDVRIIANLMMGYDGNVPDEAELTELDLSAISEAMNQMVGSASTSLSSILNYKIDIDTPSAFVIDFSDEEFSKRLGFDETEEIVMISFRMVVGDLIDSNIMQILPIEFAKEMVATLKSGSEGGNVTESNIAEDKKSETKQEVASKKENTMTPKDNDSYEDEEDEEEDYQEVKKRATRKPKKVDRPKQNINAKAAKFENFDAEEVSIEKENIDIIMDVPLEVTVELGRTYKKIKNILEFTPGTIIELDKIAGEPIDILVNGKFVAKGEVVVIDENFGIRITDILNVEERI